MNKIKKVRMVKSLDFRLYKKTKMKLKKTGDDVDDVEGIELVTNEQVTKEGEKELQKLKKSIDGSTGERQLNIDDIKNIVTAKHLCSCKDPITMAFEVNGTLRTLSDTDTENTVVLMKLADKTEDFAVQLIDEVNANEQLVMSDVPENVDRCASMMSGITDDAISYSQKKFVTHPLLYKKLKMRWNLGLPEALKPRGRFRALLYLLILIDTVLTPILLPIIGYAFYCDQKKAHLQSVANTQEQIQTAAQPSGKKSRLDILGTKL
ncbi:hypothetical protein OS493_017389 [Desmophyllum pertusum]|uniref:Uncharacterized protein n=1 Tax=Desmophyllum pertusum TaxID=174260 RepID=A0A9X0D8W9_9CNID|nr:hypothetical protein OS493_017389 [Desmophyllum pertusum]